MHKKGLYIKSKVRFTIFISVIIFITVFTFNIITGINVANGATYTKYKQIEICQGDTLWNIAKVYMKDEEDIRKAVYEICTINNIKASELKAGMIIKVPISEK